jgi:large subunit ribosomal protein L6
MSKIAKNPINIPDNVEVNIASNSVTVTGPLGKLEQHLKGDVKITETDNILTFVPTKQTKHSKAMSGTIRAIVNNMVEGVSKGFEKKLTLIGVGYKAAAQGSKLNLDLGFSHPIIYNLPDGISVQTPSQTEIVLKSPNKQIVGQVAAEIRAYRPPEPYKGKGVRYSDEFVVIKEAKKA